MVSAYQIRMPQFRHDTHPLVNNTYTQKERSLFLIANFVVWRERCSRVFRDTEATVAELITQVREQWVLTSGAYQQTQGG